MNKPLKTLMLIAFLLSCLQLPAYSTDDHIWNIINKPMNGWNSDGDSELNKAWSLSKTYLTVTQNNDYVNLYKIKGADGFIVSTAFSTINTDTHTIEIKARVNPIDKNKFPESESVFEANQIAVRLANKRLRLYLKYGNESGGYITNMPVHTPSGEDKYIMDTSEWHIYRIVSHPGNLTYDVYIDDSNEPALSGLKTLYNTNSNAIMIGSDKDQYCNMDIEYVKLGTGNFNIKTQIDNIVLSSDSHISGNEHTITATINTELVDEGEKLFVALYDESDNELTKPIELFVSDNKAITELNLSASLSKGKYYIKAFAENNKIRNHIVHPKISEYYIVDSSPITTQILPQVSPIDFVIDMDNYLYQPPTKEFIFPTIIDTRKHATSDGNFLNNEVPKDRYYWFHTPHDDPGGMYLYTGPTLDGPWTEQGQILTNDWAKEQGINTKHISSCHVIWNSVYNKYFMYFHGPNPQTHYATSENLVDWEYGAKVAQNDDFSFSSNEASYARVFEYEVPGHNNKYVMMLMINENNIRTIYWAHSQDGISWTYVRTPLISPNLDYKKIPGTDIKPNYKGGMGNNISGPFFMIADDRYFVLFHSSAGNIAVAEIGERFDRQIHWGEYLKHKDAVISKDDNGAPQAVSRVASPFFIQDDNGRWYLFFEAGGRQGANTAYAKEENLTNINQTSKSDKNLFSVSREHNSYILKNITSQTSSYKLYNSTGVLLTEGLVRPGNNIINIKKGLYIIQINDNGRNFILKCY